MNVVLYFSFVFFLSELILMITKRSKKGGTKTKDDRMLMILFWVAIPVGLSLGFRFANYQEWSTFNIVFAWIGLTLVLAGFIIRWWSIIQLKKDFTVDVAISNTHRLNTTGIYKNIRHPGYSGLLLICFGLSVAMNSVVSLLVINQPCLFAILYRIRIEEAILKKEFGAYYDAYSKNTFRLLPKLY